MKRMVDRFVRGSPCAASGRAKSAQEIAKQKSNAALKTKAK